MKKLELHWQIVIAIFLAGIVGTLTGKDLAVLGVTFYSVFAFLGAMFLSLLKMLIVPLLVSSIICGVGGLGDGDNLGRLGFKTISFYLTTSLIAVIIGLVSVNILQPGIINGAPAAEHLNLTVDKEELAAMVQAVEGASASDITTVFKRLIPENVINAAANGQMLGLIFFSIVFGFFTLKIEPNLRKTMFDFWSSTYEIMMHMTMWVMKFAPYGVFFLVAKTVAATGFASIQPLAVFFISVVIAFIVHAFIVMPLFLRYLGKVNPIAFMNKVSPVMLMAFSTSSSAATLPLTMETLEEEVGVSNATASFVLPLGATVNMNGTALYECAAAIFIAQAYGMDLSFVQQFTVVLVALLTSIGVAGIPAASLVAITIILGVIGLPLEGIGLLLVTDRILDMLRTSVNVFGDSCGAVIIARSEGESTTVDISK